MENKKYEGMFLGFLCSYKYFFYFFDKNWNALTVNIQKYVLFIKFKDL